MTFSVGSFGHIANRWSCSPCDIQQLWHQSSAAASDGSPADTYSCKFCPQPGSCHILASVDEDGVIKLWDTRANHSSHSQRLIAMKEAHSNAIYDVDFNCSGRHLYTCGGDRCVRMFDVQTLVRLSEFTCKNRTVKALACLPHEPNVLATGGRDGVVEVWDARVATGVSHQIHPAVNKQGRGRSCSVEATALASVTSLVFRDENFLISAGSGNGTVSVWDLRRTYSGGGAKCAHTPFERFDWLPASRGVVSMAIDRFHGSLFVSRIHDVIQRYNTSAWQAEIDHRYTGHAAGSYYVRVCVSGDGEWLVSGSSNGSAWLWPASAPYTATAATLPVAAAPVSSSRAGEVTCVSWSADSSKLATFCDDISFRLWRIDRPCGDCDADSIVRPNDADSQQKRSGITPLLDIIDRRERGFKNHRRRNVGKKVSAPSEDFTSRASVAVSTSCSPIVPPSSGGAVVRTPTLPTRRRRSLRNCPVASGSPEFLQTWLQRSSPGSATTGDSPCRRSPRKRPLPSPSSSSIDRSAASPRRTPCKKQTTETDLPVTPVNNCRTTALSTELAVRRSPRRLFRDDADGSVPPGDTAVVSPLAGREIESSAALNGCRRSPRKRQLGIGGSPTAGLPDWVRDRVSPHRPHLSPLNGRRSGMSPSPQSNWLTRLSQQRKNGAHKNRRPTDQKTDEVS